MKISFVAALVAGILACITWYVTAVQLGFDNLDVDRYRVLILYIFITAGVVISILTTRNKVFGGFITYQSAVRTGLVATIVMALIITAFGTLYYSYINPDFYDVLAAEIERAGKVHNANVQDITNVIAETNKDYGFFRMFTSSLFIGTILSLLASLALKRTPSEKEN